MVAREILTEHRKHTKLKKPTGGSFHRLELGFLGAPCNVIKDLCGALQNDFSSSYSLAYVDADHQHDENDSPDFAITYTDKISHHRIDMQGPSPGTIRQAFNACAAVLVNSNHFLSLSQIVIIDPNKRESLLRKIDRLTNVELFILSNESSEIFPFLKDHIKNHRDIKTIDIDDTASLSSFVREKIEDSVPVLNGLVLSGGKSQRMGIDKGAIVYNLKEQREHMADLISPFCEDVLMSIRSDQSIESEYGIIHDTVEGLGPYGALLSAFRSDPDSAFLSVPCDAPLIDHSLIEELIEHRNPHKFATCFYNPETQFPEPLITIWEPRSYPILLQYLSLGYSCPRKILINSDIEMIHTLSPEKLVNANTPEDMKIVKVLIANKEVKEKENSKGS